MLRTATVPKRSFAGCLTCKSRKKKCDEQKPHCERCIQGDFYCLGYDLPEHSYIKQYSGRTGVKHLDWPSHISLTRNNGPSSDLAALNGLYVLPEHASEAEQPTQACSSIQRPTRPSTFTKRVAMDPVLIEDTASFTISQFARFARELLFKPTSFPLEKELSVRMKCSEFTRWSMYLSARVLKDISDGMNGRKYTNWIFQLHQQILESPTPTEVAIAMQGRLAGLHDLAYLGFIASSTTLGYSLFRGCIPIFLRLAALDSNLWSDSATISISQAIQCTYEISKVVVHDTLIAFILGIPPLLHYDFTFPRGSAKPNNELELLYGIPPEVLYFLAKINAYRAPRPMGEMAQTLSNWHDVERVHKNGSSTIEHTSEPVKDIERFAVQETWGQATLIYFYMGVGDVN